LVAEVQLGLNFFFQKSLEISCDESGEEEFASACEEQLSESASSIDHDDDEDFIVRPKESRVCGENVVSSGMTSIAERGDGTSPNANPNECDSTSKDNQVS
jgi:hypothetical protein